MAAVEEEGVDVGEVRSVVFLAANPALGNGAVRDDEEGRNVGNWFAVEDFYVFEDVFGFCGNGFVAIASADERLNQLSFFCGYVIRKETSHEYPYDAELVEGAFKGIG